MTEHLPECGYGIELSFDGVIQPAEPCCCDRLRACEQRVKETTIPRHRDEWIADGYHHGYEVGYEAGRDAALTLARDAVAALVPVDQRVDDKGLISLVYDKGEVLAAIDALKEQS